MQLTPEIIKTYRSILTDGSAEFFGLGLALGSIQKAHDSWTHPLDPNRRGWEQFVCEYMIAMQLHDGGLLECQDDSCQCDWCVSDDF